MAEGENESGKANLNVLNEKERIGIILEEYRALRAEIVARTTMQAQINSGIGAGFITITGFMVVYNVLAGVLMILLLSILSTALSIFLFDDIHNLAERLLEIEDEINRRVGERLFSWESRFGVQKISFRSRLTRTGNRLLRVLRGVG
jgi:hypothetical protein